MQSMSRLPQPLLFSLDRRPANRTFMINTDQIKLLLTTFGVQLPTLLVCFVAGVVILGKWKEGSKGSMWALLGFGLAAVLCFAAPAAQTAVQGWVRQSGHTMVEGASVMVSISIVWSVLRAVTYALLLIAVFAGRSTSRLAVSRLSLIQIRTSHSLVWLQPMSFR